MCQFQIKLIQLITLEKKNRCQKTAQLVHSFKGEMLSFSSLLWFVWLELCWQRQHWEGKTNTKLWHHEGLISRAVPWHEWCKKWSKVTCIPPPQRKVNAKWILQLWRLDVWRLRRQTDNQSVGQTDWRFRNCYSCCLVERRKHFWMGIPCNLILLSPPRPPCSPMLTEALWPSHITFIRPLEWLQIPPKLPPPLPPVLFRGEKAVKPPATAVAEHINQLAVGPRNGKADWLQTSATADWDASFLLFLLLLFFSKTWFLAPRRFFEAPR